MTAAVAGGSGIQDDPVDFGSSRVLREDSLGVADWGVAELAWVPSDLCSGGAVAVGGKGKAGWALGRVVTGWQMLLSALL